MRTNEDEGWRRRARLFGVERLNDLDRWRMRQAEQCEQRALAHAEEQHARQEADALVAASDEIATLRGELDGLRSDVVTGLKAVGDGFDHITDSESEHTAEREQEVGALQDEVSVLRKELAAARAESMERTAKATIAVFGEIAAQRAAMDRLIETEREKNAQASSLAAEREEKIRTLQNEVSALRNELTVVRVEAAERLAAAAKATLDSFNEVSAQRATVARMGDTVRQELDDLNARTAALAGDVKALKEAQVNFKFAREAPNESAVLDMPAFLPAPGRTMN